MIRRVWPWLAVALAAVAGPTLGQEWRGAVAAEIAAVERAIAPYRDVSYARAMGWRRSTKHVPLMGEHWGQRRGVDYTVGDALDLSRPSNLIYAEIGGRHRLIAVAYVVRIGAGDPLPAGFTGPADVWHVHNLDQILAALGQRRPLLARLGTRWVSRSYASDGNRRMAMVHVWLDGRNPAGVFANLNPTLPYERLGLPAAHADGASLEAAQGVALAHPDGCGNELGAKLWLAAVGGRKKRDLMRLCRAAAEEVRASLGAPPGALNAVAARAWGRFDAERFIRLTDAERARMAAIVEGAGAVCTVQ